MFITIAASIVCVSVALLPAAAEIRRMIDERQNPTRLLDQCDARQSDRR